MKVLIRCASNEYPQHMFLSINEGSYQIFITKYPSLTIPLQKVTKHCPSNATSSVDLRSEHFQVKTSTEVIISYFNVYSLLGENFNRQHFDIFFLIFPRK